MDVVYNKHMFPNHSANFGLLVFVFMYLAAVYKYNRKVGMHLFKRDGSQFPVLSREQLSLHSFKWNVSQTIRDWLILG